METMIKWKSCFFPFIFTLVISCTYHPVKISGHSWDPDQSAHEVMIALTPVVTDIQKPVSITHAGDRSGRLFITLQTGQIVIYDGMKLLHDPFLDISELILCCGEQGLLSVAFHPDYRRKGRFFVNYTDTSGNTVIAEYRVSENPGRADPLSASVLLVIPQPTIFHNGGQLQFGPDGYLYIGAGDGGSVEPGIDITPGDNTGFDAFNNAQDPGKLLGKMLRIDVDKGHPYAVPETNPFVSSPGARGEVWSLGLRNPWRFSFDRMNGDLFIADVGRNDLEEINIQPSSSGGAENYGWPVMEGTLCNGKPEQCGSGVFVKPILEYDHGSGCAIIGGYVYRGRTIPRLNGVYLYGDFCTGMIWGGFEDSEGKWTSQKLLDSKLQISSFGEDEKGNIYVSDYGSFSSLGYGAIYRVVLGDKADP